MKQLFLYNSVKNKQILIVLVCRILKTFDMKDYKFVHQIQKCRRTASCHAALFRMIEVRQALPIKTRLLGYQKNKNVIAFMKRGVYMMNYELTAGGAAQW